MKRFLLMLLLACLPLTVLADGKVIPSIAYPAQVTIPDQRALICFTNGVERLVIETRFTGAGTNFAWIVPLPNPPVIEAATTGIFPTLQYLFQPEVVHNVPRYYLGILLGIGFIYLLRLAVKSVWNAFVICLLVVVPAMMLLPALSAAKKKAISTTSNQTDVSILDRKLVGIFETTTIASREPKALENWLHENGFLLPTNAGPVIASYVKDGWVFVASKIHRDDAKPDTSTPHPLSFTFKTDKPVYPMRLTGLDNPSLTVGLYVFADSRVTAVHFKEESCTRPAIVHPLLHQWVGTPATATKMTATHLTATLSSANMRNDVWLSQTPFSAEHRSRVYSRHGALNTALNWGAGLFAGGLLVVLLTFQLGRANNLEPIRLLGKITVISLAVTGLIYFMLPKIEVKLSKARHYYHQPKEEMLALIIALGNSDWRNTAEIRAGFQKLTSNPKLAAEFGLKDWNNPYTGGQFCEEDSPGNYQLRETNNHLELILIDAQGGEVVWDTINLPVQH